MFTTCWLPDNKWSRILHHNMTGKKWHANMTCWTKNMQRLTVLNWNCKIVIFIFFSFDKTDSSCEIQIWYADVEMSTWWQKLRHHISSIVLHLYNDIWWWLVTCWRCSWCQAYVHKSVMMELKRVIEDSEVMEEDDALWPQPDRVGRQVSILIVVWFLHARFPTV